MLGDSAGKIPGQISSPTAAAAARMTRVGSEGAGRILEALAVDGSDVLIQPKFGAYLPMEEFDEDNEMKVGACMMSV